MTQRDLETFVGNAVYNLAREILDKYSAHGFDYESEEDMKQVRIINTSASVLRAMEDQRHIELQFKVHNLIKFPPEEDKLMRLLGFRGAK